MKLTAATSVFLSDRTARGCNPRTVRWYRDVLMLFERDTGAASLEDVTIAVLRAYVVHLQSDGRGSRNARMSPVTIRKRVLALKTFCAWAKGASLLSANPADDLIAPRAPRRLPRALSHDQAQALLAVPMNPRDRCIVSLFLDTGIRISECVALDVSDVDENQGTILIRVGKGAKQRKVVFASETREALRQWIAERGRQRLRNTDALFVSARDGQRMTGSGMYKAVKRIAVAAGLDVEASPHKLRHSMASFYLDNGGGIQDLSELLGHTEISTTWIYTRVAVGGLRKKHEQFSPMNSLKKGG